VRSAGTESHVSDALPLHGDASDDHMRGGGVFGGGMLSGADVGGG
jgi:hypothetical protein